MIYVSWYALKFYLHLIVRQRLTQLTTAQSLLKLCVVQSVDKAPADLASQRASWVSGGTQTFIVIYFFILYNDQPMHS
jgi:hypothetical protein